MKPSLRERLFSALLLELSSGYYPEGARFLSLRQIATRFGVSKPTVNEVQARLLKEEYLCARPRSGTFVAHGARERAMLQLEKTPLSTIPTPRTWAARRERLRQQIHDAPGRQIAVIVHKDDLVYSGFGLPDQRVSTSIRSSQGIMEAALARQAQVHFAVHNSSETRHAEVLAWLEATAPDGVLVLQRSSSFRQFHELVDPLLAKGTPVANLFGDTQGADLINVDFNNVAGGFQATAELIARGCRKILLVSSPSFSSLSSLLRAEGARLAAQQAGVPLEQVAASIRNHEVLVPPIFDTLPPEVGVLALSHDYGVAALQQGGAAERCFPSFAFSSLQETPWGEKMPIVKMDFDGIGAAAVDALLDEMEGKEVHRSILYPMELCL